MSPHPSVTPASAVRRESDGWDLPSLLHELATPLQAALGALDLNPGGLDAEGCRRVSRALARMRDLCSAAANRRESLGVDTPMELLRQVADEVRQAHPDRRLSLLGDLASRKPHRFDRLALAQTAANWLLNAARHAPGSEIRARVRMDRRRGELCLDVEDDGEGLDEEARRRAFEPGWRSAASALRDPGGKGLGLSIVRRLALAAGGKISVGASASGGCRFTLRLPASRAQPETTAPTPGEVGGIRVAVIDDDRTCSAVAVLGLRAEGAAAETLQAGRGLVRRILKGPWETLLIDRQLGNLSGDGIVRRLRAAGWPGGIVLWTGDKREPPEGADRCLPKPASRREIADAVADAAAAARDRRRARVLLGRDLADAAASLESTGGSPRRLGPLAHRLAGALALAGHLAAARRARAVEHCCASGRGSGPLRKLIDDLRALAKGTG